MAGPQDQEHTGARSTPVFVTGLGPVCRFGLGMEDLASGFWNGIARPYGALPPTDIRRVPEFDLSEYIQTKRPYLDVNSRFALAAAWLALESAGFGSEISEPSRSGLATATVFGNMATHEAFQHMVRQKGVRLASPMLFPHCYANVTNSILSIEFGIRGYNQNFCGGSLCGATSVAAGMRAVRYGLADMMLAGGCDALTDHAIGVLTDEAAGNGLPLGEGACFLVLENESSAEHLEEGPICELGCIVTKATGLPHPPTDDEEQATLQEAVSSSISGAIERADIWEGDVGVVFAARPLAGDDPVSRAGAHALSTFSQVPTVSVHELLGETFAAGFALECAGAALALNDGSVPTVPRLEGVKRGAEIWVEQEPQPVLGDAALVIGWSAYCAVAAIFKTV